MRTLRSYLICLALAGTIFLLYGCAPRTIRAGTKPKAAPPPIPKGVKGQGISVNWLENLPDGTVRHVLDIKADSGSAMTGTRSGTFNQATGVVYQDGRPVARFTAPVINADEEKQIVTGTGRVRAVSIDPPGGTVDADMITWFMGKKKVLAEGRVMLHYRKPDQKRDFAIIGPVEHVVVDMDLKSYDSELTSLRVP